MAVRIDAGRAHAGPIRRVLVTALVAMVAIGGVRPRAQQPAPQARPTGAELLTGVLGGRATDESRGANNEYAVRLRDLTSNAMVGPVGLDQQGEFSFEGLPLARKFLVELLDLKRQGAVVCTEGPYALTQNAAAKFDVNIDCGKGPAALWLLAAGAGTAAAIALAQASTSQ